MVDAVAREYATIQPSAIREGVALERSPGGGDAVRLVSSLPALVGALSHELAFTQNALSASVTNSYG